ncbi:ABC-three component system protein [Stenotrophomonas sp.]|uniref:ABC-three component system protein n=1 Tax=Stenotrophomonas sp. TaxID=69392 RepID=UPI0028A65E38|nr:ABC-three component system protein [Stenotrophomonas sp.]
MASSEPGKGAGAPLSALPPPTPWPNANARLLGMGAGLPIQPLDRLAQFSAADFERFTLEWASDYLSTQVEVVEAQQRGGAGDKGRDVVVWLDPSGTEPRRWKLYQCKHYGDRLGPGVAAGEIAKVLYYTLQGDYTSPEEYWFVTHKGTTSTLQDLLDDPNKLRDFVTENWDKHCAGEITSKAIVALTGEMKDHIASFDFSIFKAKQPLELISEHAQTRYHLTVFGAPLIERPPPPEPPSSVAPTESGYITQLFEVIGEAMETTISDPSDFIHLATYKGIFERSRITFYCAEGLKELARDQMADPAFFETLLSEFREGLYFTYTTTGQTGLNRLKDTVKAAQSLQLGGHVLAPHVQAKDREGMCHQMANEGILKWCGT